MREFTSISELNQRYLQFSLSAYFSNIHYLLINNLVYMTNLSQTMVKTDARPMRTSVRIFFIGRYLWHLEHPWFSCVTSHSRFMILLPLTGPLTKLCCCCCCPSSDDDRCFLLGLSSALCKTPCRQNLPLFRLKLPGISSAIV